MASLRIALAIPLIVLSLGPYLWAQYGVVIIALNLVAVGIGLALLPRASNRLDP